MAAQALEFVRKSPLATKKRVSPLSAFQPDKHEHSAKQHADYAKQGFVCGGSTASFTEYLNGQQKSDVLNSTLFAQLVANDYYSRETPEWHETYVEALRFLGYEFEGTGLAFEKYSCESPTFTMGTVVADILMGLATDDEMLLAQANFYAMETNHNHGNSHAVQLFDNYSKTSVTSGGFQIIPCTIDSENHVRLILASFYFKSAQDGNNILSFDYNTSSTSLFTAGMKCHLRMHVYDAVRGDVLKLLGDTANTAVEQISLS